MGVFSTLKSSVGAPFDKERVEHELDEELQSYLELLIDEKVQAGVEPGKARRQALIELGGAEQIKTTLRETRHGAGFDTLIQDLRFTLRLLRKSPGFATVVILTLAIGIGANTALFSSIKALLLSSLPYEEPARLVAMTKTYEGRPRGPVSRLDSLDYRRLNRTFEGFGVLSGNNRFTLTGGDRARPVFGTFVSWNLFQILGVRPDAGRLFLESEENQGGANLILVSHSLWQDLFAGGEHAIGSSLHLNGLPYEIVGVMPPGFEFMSEAELWVLIDRDCPIDMARDSHSMWAIGRLQDGVTLEQAQQDMDRVAAILAEQYPDTNKDKGLRLYDLREFMVAHVRPSLNLLIVTTALVLLIACGNVAGLMLARGQSRVPEMAMRAALGAPRSRLIRQLMTESVILTLLAGGIGVIVAFLFHGFLLRLLPAGDAGVPVARIDGGVLLFALVISIVTGLVVGIIPALRVTSFNIWRKLEISGRTTESGRGTRLRTLLVIAQVAMSVSLLIGCGLMIRSMVQLTRADLGFEPKHLAGGTIAIQADDHPSMTERAGFFASLIEEIEALPGVERAALITKLPIASGGTDWPIWHAADPRPEPRDSDMALARIVSPGYFDTMAIPLLRGRDIAHSDREEAARVLVISEAVARGLFPQSDPIGQMVKLGWYDEPFEIVGVVGNAKLNSVRNDFTWAMYMSSAQYGWTNQWLALRAQGDADLLSASVRKILDAKDSNALFGGLQTMETIIDNNLSGFRVVMLALGILAIVAMLLTAIGLYGVLAYHVSQRTNEFGIRVALGATSREVVGLVFKKGLVMVGAGIIFGLLGASLVSRLIQNLLYQTGVLEPAAYAGAGAFLGAVALIACFLPAWRASRISPVEALRRE